MTSAKLLTESDTGASYINLLVKVDLIHFLTGS